MKFIELLRAFFRLGVGEGEPPAEDPPAEEPAPDLDVDLDADDPAPEPEPKAGSPEADAALSAIKAEKERGDRFERELGEIRSRQQPHQPTVDEETRHENARLADPAITELEKWQIGANRKMRQTMGTAQYTLARAEDTYDRTAFRALESRKPVLFKKYEAEVEKELAKVRSNGGNATREAIFTYLIGRDALGDKFTRKKAADKDIKAAAVPRGKLPGARSDVSGKNAMSEHEKRRQRLQDVQI